MAILEIFGRQVFWQVLRDQTGPDLIIKKTTNQSFHQENICRKFSVADPINFDTDPNPLNRFHDYGSGSWFGSKEILTLWFLLNVTKKLLLGAICRKASHVYNIYGQFWFFYCMVLVSFWRYPDPDCLKLIRIWPIPNDISIRIRNTVLKCLLY